jgi:hypothetical protein
MQFYGLLCFAFGADVLNEYRWRLRTRAEEFANEFIHWFARDGAALPYGRSLTYRFGQAAFWSALAFCGVKGPGWGVIKGIILRHLRWWLHRPIWTETGLLPVGYGYSNTLFGETYNSPCSPYWALKTFLPLVLSADHPFWTECEKELPPLPELTVQKNPQMLICRHRGHVFAFCGASGAPVPHRLAPEKYSKFCYSTLFGFSVPRRQRSLLAGVDSMLMLRDSEGDCRVRHESNWVRLAKREIVAQWAPWRDVTVTTWVIPFLPWHVRVHRIESNRILQAVEGGFSLGLDEGASALRAEEGLPRGLCAVATSSGMSAIMRLYGRRRGELVVEDPNTNIVATRSAVPTLASSHRPGVFWLGCGVLALASQDDGVQWLRRAPQFRKHSDGFTVTTNRGMARFSYLKSAGDAIETGDSPRFFKTPPVRG